MRLAALLLLSVPVWAQTGSLSGQVVDRAGLPIHDARLALYNDDQGNPGLYAATQPNGEFRIERVPPGSYYLSVMHYQYPGPLDGPQYGAAVEVKPGRETAGLRLTLQPPGSVTGRVVDDDGLPVEGCQILLFPAAPATPRSLRLQAATNDKGAFRIERVPADRYIAYARCNQVLPTEHLLGVVSRDGFEIRSTWLPMFYPDSPTPDGAQAFTAAPGLDPVLEFHLRATPVSTVTGSFSSAAGVSWTEPIRIELHLPADAGSGVAAAYLGSLDEKTGLFVIPAVPPGSYELVATTGPRDLATPGAATLPVVVGDTAPKPFPLTLSAGVPVTGVVENGPGVRAIQPSFTTITENTPTGPVTRQVKQSAGTIKLESVDAGQALYVPAAEIDSETGRFTLPAVPPGRWHVRCALYGGSAYAETIEFNEKRLSEDVLEIVTNQAAALRFVLSARPNVAIQLENAPGPESGKWMVLAAREAAAVTSSSDMVAIGQPGQLAVFNAPAPGRYRFVAIPYGFASSRDRAALLQVLAQSVEPVEVTTADRQTISVRCFSVADVEKAIRLYLYGDNPPPSAP